MNGAEAQQFDPSHELLTIPACARRIRCTSRAVYKRIAAGKMPPGSVVYLPGTGAMRIDWTVFAQAVRIRGT